MGYAPAPAKIPFLDGFSQSVRTNVLSGKLVVLSGWTKKTLIKSMSDSAFCPDGQNWDKKTGGYKPLSVRLSGLSVLAYCWPLRGHDRDRAPSCMTAPRFCA